MSEDFDPENKTEPASQRRLDQAYGEGQVALSRDIQSLACLTAGVLTLCWLGPALLHALTEWVKTASNPGGHPLREVLAAGLRPALLGLGVMGAATFFGAAATVVQTRGGFWPELAVPNFSRLMEAHALSRWLKRDFWEDLLFALLKVGVLGVALAAPGEELSKLLADTLGPADAQLFSAFVPLGQRLLFHVLPAMAVLAALDFLLARRRHFNKLKMTKEEARREYKEDEGDPLVRSRRKRAHRALIQGQAKAEVPRADALVVNPTHVAVALRYRREDDAAPRVTAKGKGALAEHMRALAREHGVPIVQDVPLARLLYKKVKVGRAVPAETYRAVAAVLALVYRMTGRVPGTGARV